MGVAAGGLWLHRLRSAADDRRSLEVQCHPPLACWFAWCDGMCSGLLARFSLDPWPGHPHLGQNLVGRQQMRYSGTTRPVQPGARTLRRSWAPFAQEIMMTRPGATAGIVSSI